MGKVIYFPSGNIAEEDDPNVVQFARTYGGPPSNFGGAPRADYAHPTPTSILEDLLVLARADQLVFLAVAATRRDGHLLHAELGLVTDEEDDANSSGKVQNRKCLRPAFRHHAPLRRQLHEDAVDQRPHQRCDQ